LFEWQPPLAGEQLLHQAALLGLERRDGLAQQVDFLAQGVEVAGDGGLGGEIG